MDGPVWWMARVYVGRELRGMTVKQVYVETLGAIKVQRQNDVIICEESRCVRRL